MLRMTNQMDQAPYPIHQHKFKQHLDMIALGLMAASIIYLIAANWFMLPQIFQLAIPQVLLLLSATASVYCVQHDALRQTFHTITGLMIGLSLAVIGQVYQTGADSYLLFTLWSVLLIPWFYQRNIGVFLLFSIVSLLAVYLGIRQTTLSAIPYLKIAAISIWLLALFIIAMCYATHLKYIFIAAFAAQNIFVLFHYFLYSNATFLWFGFVPVLLIAAWFHRQKQPLSFALISIIFGFSVTAVVLNHLLKHIDGEVNQLFVGGVMVLIWFSILTVLLKKFLGANKFNIMPLAFGAWLAGLFFSSVMLLFWGTFSLIFGIIFMLVAGFILYQSHSSIFVKQLSYCLFISGQVACLGHLFDKLDLLWPCFILQIIITSLLFYFRAHWFFFMMQLLSVYALGYISIVEDSRNFYALWGIPSSLMICILNYSFFSLLFIFHRLKQHYPRSILMVILASLVVSAFGNHLFNVSNNDNMHIILLILPLLFFSVFAYVYLKPQMSKIELMVCTLFIAVLIYLGYFEIFILTMILAWALKQKDFMIHGFTLISLCALMWHLYYSLALTFLEKSLTIFISGIIIFILAQLLNRTPQFKESNA